MSTRSIRLYTHLDVKIHPIFQILMTEQDVQRSLVPIFATREELKLLANDPIMSGRSIPLFRHFQCQNLSTGYAFIHSSEIFFQFYFWPLRRHCRYSEMILFCRKDQYSSLYTLNLKIRPLLQILWAFLDGSKKWGGKVRSRRSNRRNLINIEEDGYIE